LIVQQRSSHKEITSNFASLHSGPLAAPLRPARDYIETPENDGVTRNPKIEMHDGTDRLAQPAHERSPQQ
jgi:hypothetical protein